MENGLLGLVVRAVAAYTLLFVLGLTMYLLNARLTDQPCWEYANPRDAVFFDFVVIPLVIGPMLLGMEVASLAIIGFKNLKRALRRL